MGGGHLIDQLELLVYRVEPRFQIYFPEWIDSKREFMCALKHRELLSRQQIFIEVLKLARVVAAITLWNTVYLERATEQRVAKGGYIGPSEPLETPPAVLSINFL